MYAMLSIYGDFNLEATNWFCVLDTTARCGCAYNYVNISIKIEIANLCENYYVYMFGKPLV